MAIETAKAGVVLAGGASLRMGRDKARILVGGVPSAERICRLLHSGGWDPVVLGGEPVEGFLHLPDQAPGSGPLAALRGLTPPAAALVMVVSCDVFGFRPEVAAALEKEIGGHDAAVPVVEGQVQPLCALYRGRAWESLRALGSERVRDWLRSLDAVEVGEARLTKLGVLPEWAAGANSPAELSRLAPPG